MRKRRGTLIALATLVLAAVLIYVLWPGPDLRVGSTEVADVVVRVGSRTPASYRIVYRVESHAAGQVVVNSEDIVVRRPFEARNDIRTGAPPGKKRQGETVNAFARLKNQDLVLAVGPGPASLDRRPDRLFPAATKSGRAEMREVRRVAGRACRVYRTVGSPGESSLAKIEDVKDSYTDTCVDEAGLVLEEVGVTKGRLLSRRLAVRIDETPEIGKNAFTVGDPTIPVRMGGGSVRTVSPDSRPPGEFWEFGSAPRGYEHQGRYAVVPPQTGFDDPRQRQQLIAFTSDVWVDGSDTIIVEQGATLGGSAPFVADPNGMDLRLGELGRGQLVYSLITSEVRVLMKGGRFVRVTGTASPPQLVATARSLEAKEGGELVYLDEPPS